MNKFNYFLLAAFVIAISINSVEATFNVTSDLSGTDTGNWIGTSSIYGMAAGSNNNIYLGIDTGLFGVYDPVTNVTSDLSATDTGNWIGTNLVYKLAYDSYNNKVYLLMNSNGLFGVYDPVTNVTSDLSGTDTGNWIGTTGFYSIAYDSISHKVYLGLNSGKFGVYDPVTNVTTNLSGSDTGNWIGTDVIYSLAYNSDNRTVYLGTASGLFGVYDPVTNVTSDLSATDTGNWIGTNVLYGLTYNSNNKKLYLGGSTGIFGYYDNITNIASSIGSIFALNLQSITYSSALNKVYQIYSSGKISVYDPVTNVTSDLSGTDPGNWIGTSNGLYTIATSVNKTYFSWVTGKFGVYEANYPPSVNGVSISPYPAFVNNNLTGSGTFYDADGNASTSTYRWFKNGVLISGANLTTLATGNYSIGDNVTFEYTPKDIYNIGTAVNSSAAFIYNDLVITFYDEVSGNLLSGINVTAAFSSTVFSENLSTSTGTMTTHMLSNPSDYIITYSADGYSQRQFSFSVTNTSALTLALYLRSVASTNVVLVTTYDSTNNKLIGAYVYMYKKNITGTNDFLVEMCVTDINGQCQLSADVSTTTYIANTTYRFFLNYQNVVVADSGYTKLSGNTLFLQSGVTTNPLQPFFNVPNIVFTPITYANSVFSVTATDTGNTPRLFCFYTNRRTGGTTTQTGSNCTTSAGITLTLNANSSIGDETEAYLTVVVSGAGNEAYLLTSRGVLNNSGGGDYSAYLLIFIALGLGSTIFFGMGYYPQGAAIAVLGVLVILYQISSGLMTKIMLVVLGIIIVIVLLVMGKRE